MRTRSLDDRLDDSSGFQVHVIYALPKGGLDHQFDVTSRIPYSIASVNTWLEGQIGRKVRFDTYQGGLDIQFVQLPRSDAEYASGDKFSLIQYDVKLLTQGAKNLLVFYDGPGTPAACGQSTIAPFTSGPQFSLVYTDGCWSHPAATPDAQPNFSDYIPIHELFHSFGAPHTPQDARKPPEITSDKYYKIQCDLMYTPKSNACLDGQYLDPLGLFYYNPDGFSGGRINTYESPYLTPPPGSN